MLCLKSGDQHDASCWGFFMLRLTYLGAGGCKAAVGIT